MRWFALVTLAPVILLSLGAFWGGVWAVCGLVYMTGFVYLMDRLIVGTVARTGPSGEFPIGEPLAILLGLAHLVMMPLAVFSIAGNADHSLLEKLLLFIGFGLFFGQISNANAHELIHKSARWPRRLGKAVYISLLFGHHASAHPRVHHVYVASENDPNTARLGEGFYHFWPRAWIGSFRLGWHAETHLRTKADPRPPPVSHPYVVYIGGAVMILVVTGLWLGPFGTLALIAVATYAQMQLLISDYVQHYGLVRPRQANGKLAIVGPQHSWNAPHFFSSALMLNAPRHSDHHMHPSRTYPSLKLDQTMPILPRSLPVMAAIALVPPLWRRIMAPHVARLGNDTPSQNSGLD